MPRNRLQDTSGRRGLLQRIGDAEKLLYRNDGNHPIGARLGTHQISNCLDRRIDVFRLRKEQVRRLSF
jgi:hypothetical protein